MGTLWGKRGKDWTKNLSSGKEFTDNCMKGIAEEVEKSHSYNVLAFDRESHYFVVQETVNNRNCRPLTHFNVNLQTRTCDCGRFQTFHLPCSHAIAACSHINHDYTTFIPDLYRVINVFKVYIQSFLGVPQEDSWPPYLGDTLMHDERMRRNKKGRPNSTRIRTEMDTVEKIKDDAVSVNNLICGKNVRIASTMQALLTSFILFSILIVIVIFYLFNKKNLLSYCNC